MVGRRCSAGFGGPGPAFPPGDHCEAACGGGGAFLAAPPSHRWGCCAGRPRGGSRGPPAGPQSCLAGPSSRRSKVPPGSCRGPSGRRTGEAPLPAAWPGVGPPLPSVARWARLPGRARGRRPGGRGARPEKLGSLPRLVRGPGGLPRATLQSAGGERRGLPPLSCTGAPASGRGRPGRTGRLEAPGEQDEGAAVFHPPEDTKVEDCPSHSSSEQDALLRKLQALWAWRDMEKLREEMRLGFASLHDPLAWLLDVLDCCGDWRGPGLLTHIVRELQGWIKSHASDQPSGLKLKMLQDRLFPLLTRCNVSLMQPLLSIYQLHTVDRQHLLCFLSQLCQQGKFKEAATLSIKLKLQPDLEFEKVCVPLLLQDKIELVEAYVEGSPELQQSLLRLLDSWSMPGFQAKDLARQYQALPGKWPEKINCRMMHKMAFRLLDKYSLGPELCPHILNQRHLGTLKYLLHKRFVEKSMTQENWADHIQGIVQDNRWLQEQLVQLLTRYAGLRVAAQWARHYSLLRDSLPPGLADRMEEPAGLERDDAPEHWDSTKEGCYQLPVPRGDILLLSTWEEVMACQEQVLQPGQVVGIDMEWRPSFSTIGGKPRVSVVQLAIWGHVFLLDMLQLLQQGERGAPAALCAFFQTLLADPAIVKLGYGMSGDLHNLMATCGISRDVDLQLCGILDLQLIHQKLPKRSKKSCQPPLDPWQAKDKAWGSKPPEKGLSLLVQEVLGRPLNKTEQLSNWEKRPLRETQILYAASDAYCLLEVHAKLLKDPAAFGLSSEVLVVVMRKAGESPKAKARKPPREQERPASVLEEAPRASVGILVQDFRVVCDNMLQGLGRLLRCLGVDVQILGNNDEHRRAAEIAREENRVILSSGLPFHSLRSQVGEGQCFSVSCSEKARDQALQVLKHFNVRVALTDVFSRCQACNCNRYVKVSKERMALLRKQSGCWTGEDGEACLGDPGPTATAEPPSRRLTLHQPACSPRWEGLEAAGPGDEPTLLPTGICLRVEAVPPGVLSKEEPDCFYCCSQCGQVFWEGSHLGRLVSQFREVLDLPEES